MSIALLECFKPVAADLLALDAHLELTLHQELALVLPAGQATTNLHLGQALA